MRNYLHGMVKTDTHKAKTVVQDSDFEATKLHSKWLGSLNVIHKNHVAYTQNIDIQII